MRIRQWQHTQRYRWVKTLILLFVILGSLPAQLTILPPFIDSLLDDNVVGGSILEKNEAFITLPRLMRTTTHLFDTGFETSHGPTLISQGNPLTSNFAIGQQTGTGGGTYNIYDSFNWTGQEVMNTSNEYVSNKPTSNADSLSITNSTGFNRQYGVFNITNVIAEYNKSSIEDDTTSTYWTSDTNLYYEVAMSFNISIDYAYLKKVRTYTAASTGANGTIYITDDDTGGKPDETSIKSSKEILNKAGIGWHEYTFDSEILLERGQTYFIVMNESTLGGEYWWWYYTLDSALGDGDNESAVYYRQGEHWGGTWYPTPTDLPLQIEILPVEWNGTHYNPTTYANPSELDFTYESSEGSSKLSTFKQFQWNDSTWHKFSTNTSVSFDLSFVANYTYALSPISGTTTYLVNNGTLSFWNVSFSTVSLNTTYSVRNRTITIKGLMNDWNGSAIYHDGSLVFNETDTGGLNTSVMYTNQSNTMVINASILSNAKDWDVSFIAPNYITSFNWQISNSNITTATTMDTLKANYTFISPNIGGLNFSIWIKAPDGTLVNSSLDNTFGTNDLHNWDINQSIHNALLTDKANGTYQTYAFWENTTNNQVGFYTRNITVFIHTTFFVEAPDEVLEDTWLNVTIHYNATHIETGVNNGNVTGLFGWNKTSEAFDQPVAFGLYNLSIWIDEADHDPGESTNVTIFAEMPWYQNHTEIWNITVVSATKFSIIDVPANLILEYGQTYLLKVNYTYSGLFLPEANMTVDGDNENYTQEIDHYSYLLDTRNYNSSESYYNLEIRLNRSGYLTQKLYFNLTVTAGPTTLHQAYTPAVPSIYYTENYSFSVFYNNSVDNKGITDANYIINPSLAINFWYANPNGYYYFNLSSISLSLGIYNVNITLSHSNFQSNFIVVSFNIVEMPTQVLDSYNISSNQIMVEETITITIESYLTNKSEAIGTIDNALILLNDSSVDTSHISFSTNAPFTIGLDTVGIQYGKYNMTVILSTYGYVSQAISFDVSIDGYETEISVEIEPGKNIQQGEDIIFIASLAYFTGGGAGVTQQVGLGGVNITFYIVLEYENETTRIYKVVKQTDDSSYQATYIIEGIYTKDATRFTNVTIYSAPGLSGLPYTYSMPANELETYKILPPAIDIIEVTTAVLIAVVAFLVGAFVAVSTVRIFRRRRRVRKQLIIRHDIAIEQSFEDIKSIRLIIARHESGLQFYSEKTIAELTTDTDALSGMSAALSSFMEEVSESMVSRPEDIRREKIEVMSREGLHMLVWHGFYSSLIIISEIRLPDYFRDRLEGLGKELEAKYVEDLQDFYSTDQIPYSVVKKIVRKYIPLHYFSAFVLNEGVLTLDSIKLSKKDKNMLKLIKEVLFERQGVEYLFSEQIISHLSRHYKRSEAIEFLDKAVIWNLLVECSQDDLIQLGK
ncbi:MAG: hypothetical protein ACFE95_11655 [Candidatus Hodarchaeota archaeon]